MLAARRLSGGYHGVAAFRDLELEVGDGEIVALLGANGAGKTTTLMTLAGALAPIEGDVEWLGARTTAPLHERVNLGLAFVPEDRSVFMSLSVAENLRMGNGTTAEALELFPELRPHLRRRAGLLSGGQQQILALARALASRPKVLLADELSLGLAPLVVRRLLRAVKEAAARGIGVLLVEQHVRQAVSIADRVYVLQRGELVFESSAAEARTRLDEIQAAYLSTAAAAPQ